MTPADAPFRRVGIAGLGLMGGSVALATKATWPDVTVVGCDAEAQVAAACAQGAVATGATGVESLADCDLIVLAVPMSAMSAMIQAVAATGTRATVTDVGSTKRGVMAAAADAGLGTFVGGHPMAGAERPGLAQARADLFVDRPWLLVNGQTDDAIAHRVEAFVRGLGARPAWMDEATHDRTVAYVSHLPQVLATALMAAAEAGVGVRGAEAAGPAFGEMTRLASSPPEMWQRVLSDNADFVAEALARFARDLPSLADLQSGAWARTVLPHAGDARRRWRRQDRPS